MAKVTVKERLRCAVCGSHRSLETFGLDNETGAPIEGAPLPEAATVLGYYGGNRSIRWEFAPLSRAYLLHMRARLREALARLEEQIAADED